MIWSAVPLGEIADLASGFGFPRDYQGDTKQCFPFFRVSDMNLRGNDVFMQNHSNTVSPETLKALGARVFPAGTIIFPNVGAAIATEKKRILATPSTYDNNVMGAVPKQCVHPKFLYYWFLRLRLSDYANPGPVPSIRKSVMERIPVHLPAPMEQARIIELLDEGNFLRKVRCDADAKASQVLPAIFFKMFGDPIKNPMGWPTKTMMDICDEIYRYPTYYNIGYEDTGIPEVRGELLNYDGTIETDPKKLRYISPETAEKFPRTTLTSGDIVMTVRGTVGKLGLVPRELKGANITANLLRISPNGSMVRSLYLFAFLSSAAGIGQISAITKSTTIATFRSIDFQKLCVPIPPLDKQDRFGDLASAARTILSAVNKACVGLEATLDALIQRAFSGQLTAKWRQAHINDLKAEIALQARLLSRSEVEMAP
jgi:type I restriction enzyme, S subunit